MQAEKLGLYIHVPFCRSLCHYCDFAKTANYSSEHVERYFSALLGQTKAVFSTLTPPLPKIGSVFFGGGTPGLFSVEYQSLMDLIRAHVAPEAEVTIEVNPEDITDESLQIWRDLGFNRLSMGVQSFQDKGLKQMTRNHSREQTRKSIDQAANVFANTNIDLIYGWERQTLAEWEEDLHIALSHGITHLSLYNLIFEPRTPFGRKEERGLSAPLADELLTDMYRVAGDLLGAKGWIQDEVSNWSLPGFSCFHNWLYWQNQSFIGIGCGAFGLWNFDGNLGFRYWFPREFRTYLRHYKPDTPDSLLSFAENQGAVVEHRDEEAWLMEYIGGALRSSEGIHIGTIEEKTGRTFHANQIVQEGMNRGLLILNEGVIQLDRTEWFRENRWALEMIMSFQR